MALPLACALLTWESCIFAAWFTPACASWPRHGRAIRLAACELRRQSLAVARAFSKGGLVAAREAVGLIVGRDTSVLDEQGVARAAVETVAENASDGVIAPLFYLMIGGAPLGMAYKAVNTLDSMVGYKNERYIDFGRASARLDDAVNWIPSRLSALFMIAVCPIVGPRAGRRASGAVTGVASELNAAQTSQRAGAGAARWDPRCISASSLRNRRWRRVPRNRGDIARRWAAHAVASARALRLAARAAVACRGDGMREDHAASGLPGILRPCAGGSWQSLIAGSGRLRPHDSGERELAGPSPRASPQLCSASNRRHPDELARSCPSAHPGIPKIISSAARARPTSGGSSRRCTRKRIVVCAPTF
ncbi:MAG: CobD/CbiB family cobalamin biosynthesis protein [Collinsella sp.]